MLYTLQVEVSILDWWTGVLKGKGRNTGIVPGAGNEKATPLTTTMQRCVRLFTTGLQTSLDTKPRVQQANLSLRYSFR